jgi:hypothetical protein
MQQKATAKGAEWYDVLCVALSVVNPLHRKLLRALPFGACGRDAAAFPAISRAWRSPRLHSRRREGQFSIFSNYMIFSVLRGPKLHLRRFKTSQM